MNPIQTLKYHNEWRRDGKGEMCNPAELGKAIDTVIADYEAMQKQNNELRAKVAKYESVLCQTCHGAGTVLAGIDDGRDCPECAQSLADIRAEAVESILNLDFDCETANSDVAYSSTTIQDHANRIKEG